MSILNTRHNTPELRRFLSADTIVPEPGNPQAFGRYAYVYNDPVNLIDPTGHCVEQYEAGSDEWNACFDALYALTDYYIGLDLDELPNEYLSWLMVNATTEEIIGILTGFGVDYEYRPDGGYEHSGPTTGNWEWQHRIEEKCRYWESCWDKQADPDYWAVYAGVGPVGFQITVDDWGNGYFSVQGVFPPQPGISIKRGDIDPGGGTSEISQLSTDLQEATVKEATIGNGVGFDAAVGPAVGVSTNYNVPQDVMMEAGLGTLGANVWVGRTWLVWD